MIDGPQPTDPKWWERIAALEAIVDSLAKDVTQVVQSVRELSRSVSSRSETNWGVLIGGGTLILGIVGLVGGAIGAGILRDMNRLETQQLAHETWALDKAMEIEFERGKAQQQREDLRANYAKLDLDLQREMRDVNATTEAKLVALDRRIQTEITNTVHLLQGELHTLSEYQLRAREINAGQGERTQALERAVYGGEGR